MNLDNIVEEARTTTNRFQRHIIIILMVMTVLTSGIVVFGTQGLDAFGFWSYMYWGQASRLTRLEIVGAVIAGAISMFLMLPVHIYKKKGTERKFGIAIRKKKWEDTGRTYVKLWGTKKQRGDTGRFASFGLNWTAFLGEYQIDDSGEWVDIQGEDFELQRTEALEHDARVWEERAREREYEIRRLQRRNGGGADDYGMGGGYYRGRGRMGLPPMRSEVSPDVGRGEV